MAERQQVALMAGDSFTPEFWPANKLIGELEGVLVKAEDIIGQLKNTQIESLEAPKITGQLTNEQIAELEAAKVAGQLTNAQIQSLETSKLLGQIKNVQIEDGSINAAKLAVGAVTASKILAEVIEAIHLASGSVTTAKLAAGAVTAAKMTVVELSAITANLGSITAGIVTGVLFRDSVEELATFSKEGIKLKGATSEEIPVQRKIDWIRTDDKTEIGFIGGYNIGTVGKEETVPTNFMVLKVRNPKNTQKARVSIFSANNTTPSQVLLEATNATPETGAFLVKPTELMMIVPGLEKLLLDKNSKSSFLQLAGEAAKHKINFGTTTVKWAGGKPESEIKEIAHGLGGAAVFVLGGAQTTNTFFVVGEPSGTEKIKLQGYVPGGSPPAGTERTIYWVAIS